MGLRYIGLMTVRHASTHKESQVRIVGAVPRRRKASREVSNAFKPARDQLVVIKEVTGELARKHSAARQE